MNEQVVLDIMSVALIPMGLLPVVAAIVLARHIHSPSTALRERARLAVLLGMLGVVVTYLAANRVFHWNLDTAWVVVLFGTLLIAIDLASGYWLWQYLRGRFT